MAKLPFLSELTGCPHCGSEEVYTKERASGHIINRKMLNGEPADNTGMYEHLRIESSVWVYCGCCQEKIARNDDGGTE